MKSTIIWRSIVTVVSLFIWGYLQSLVSIGSQLALGSAGVDQLRNSDAAIVQLTLLQKIASSNFSLLLFIALLVWMWYPVLRKFMSRHDGSGPLVLALALGAAMYSVPQNGLAYYDKIDRAEWAEIGANQSAFMLPMVGANKDKQGQYGSIEYLQANKVAAKRVQIPHAKADNTSMFTDYYVSTHRLFLLDRTPYAREWHSAATKGTSAKNEGFRFESSDSLTIETAVAISAFVKEEDAAKFFYWFGATSAPKSAEPGAVFASVANGRSLSDVMDSIVRPRVQTLLAKGYGRYKLIEGITKKADIMDDLEKVLKAEFAEQGITIRSVGYADELTLSDSVQKVLNEMFTVQLRYANREAYASTLNIDRQRAEIGVTEATALTMQKWNGQINFPSVLVASENFLKNIFGFFSSNKETAAAAKK